MRIHTQKIIAVFSSFAVLITGLALQGLLTMTPTAFASATDGTIDPNNVGNQYAWSENAGWINFGTGVGAGDIHVTALGITGHAWSDNYGWINMAPTGSGLTFSAPGDLTGSAWGESTGYIDFDGVSIDDLGFFMGTATGTITGTINFDCATCVVETDFRPNGTGGSSRRITEEIALQASGGGGGGGGGSVSSTESETETSEKAEIEESEADHGSATEEETKSTPDDIDGDGVKNENDPDVDGDGVANVFDDNIDDDAKKNSLDTDDDEDGVRDNKDETPGGIGTLDDIDGDGVKNEDDPDIDGDGIANGVDPNVDGDTLVNISDLDIDGDGIANNQDDDADGDGIANNQDNDGDKDEENSASKNEMEQDSTPFGVGTQEDIDGDGIPNGEDIDVDGDGLLNGIDDDVNGNGVINRKDPDLDSDGRRNIDDDDRGYQSALHGAAKLSSRRRLICSDNLIDIAEEVEHDAIFETVKRNFFLCLESGYFTPEGLVTRADMIKLVSIGLGQTTEHADRGRWYVSWLKFLLKEKIVQREVSPERFEPRADILALILKAMGIDIEALPKCISQPYMDIPADAWFCPVIVKSQELGLIPRGGFWFNPFDLAKRNWTAGVIYRAFVL
jgi:hypothetical protein